MLDGLQEEGFFIERLISHGFLRQRRTIRIILQCAVRPRGT